MGHLLEIARTGVAAVLLHPLRGAVTAGCLVVLLLPYLAGLGVARGIQQDAETSIRVGPDLYVTGRQFGREVPIPLSVADQVRKIDGVIDVMPRIVGALTLGKDSEPAVVVGIPREKFPPEAVCVEGDLGSGAKLNELVIGTELARRLRLQVGTLVPPFYESEQGERVSRVAGLFKSDVSAWQSRVVFTSFETAAEIFDQPGLATDLLVTCRPGYAPEVRAAVLRTISAPAAAGQGTVRPRVVTREELAALLPGGLLHREGIFSLLFVLAFVMGILVVLVTSGFGASERRREIGILKATGWQTDEVLLRSLVESFCLGLAGASLSVILAFAWLKWLNGYWIAGVLLAGVGTSPSFTVPFRLTPLPAFLGLLIGLVVVMTGTLYSTWRSAVVPPREAMRF